MTPRVSALLWLLVLPGVRAVALDQLVHRDVTRAACLAAGFPDEFCTEIATASTNVDATEWNTMAAHAQAESAEALCPGAEMTLLRLHGLGEVTRAGAAAFVSATNPLERQERAIALAAELGRALHTVQDLCAHAGMTNVQHAWFSAADTCTGSTTSPDAVPAARTCAEEDSQAFFVALAAELEERALTPDLLDDLFVAEYRMLPNTVQLCEYLVSADEWDGTDRRWKLEVMRPLLRAAFLAGMDGAAGPAVSCEELPAAPVAAVDVSAGPAWCPQAESVCRSAGREGLGCGCSAGGGPTLAAVLLVARVSWRRRRAA